MHDCITDDEKHASFLAEIFFRNSAEQKYHTKKYLAVIIIVVVEDGGIIDLYQYDNLRRVLLHCERELF